MDDGDWLEKPKWGSNSDSQQAEELTKAFKGLGHDTLSEAEQDPLEHNAWGGQVAPEIQLEPPTTTEELKEEPPRVEDDIASHTNNTLHSQQLLSSLAPDQDPLHNITSGNSLKSPSKNDPLFTGLNTSPIAIDYFEEGSQEPLQGCVSPTKKHGKVQRLFSTTMLRRKPLGEEERKDLIIDPLADIADEEKGEAFTEEDLKPTSPISKKALLQQVEGPLFELPKKRKNSGETNKYHEKEVEEVITYEIEVVDPIKVAELTFSHVEYTVHTQSSIPEIGDISVKRRYRDFRWLYRQLQNNHWGCIIPPPPDKQAVGRFKQDFIENRRFQMERMLQKIAHNPVLRKDEDFIMFLSSTNFSQDSKVREHLTGSRASVNKTDLSEIHISELKLLGPEDAESVIKNGGLENDSTAVFMGISFSSAPKYSEPDTFFVEKRKQTDLLEDQLKQLYKSLELVDSQKNELVSVISEFSNTLGALVNLEASKKISVLLSDFAAVHRRIMESLQRSSLQDSLTLGITIDEYLRSLGSIRAAFNQRAKLGHYLVIVESDMSKKQAQLQKLTNSNKGPPEKIDSTKKELSILQRRQKMIHTHWEKIAMTLKSELSSFYDAKITDFRNNMEIYLESAIETQKECIELWETFYQNSL